MAELAYSASGYPNQLRLEFGAVSNQFGTWRRITPPCGLVVTASMEGPSGGFMALNGGVDATEGNPAPSFRLRGGGRKMFAMPIAAGARTITAHLKQANSLRQRPTLTLMANTALGIAANITETAGAGAGWVTVTINFTATASGVGWVQFMNPDTYFDAFAYIDNLNIDA